MICPVIWLWYKYVYYTEIYSVATCLVSTCIMLYIKRSNIINNVEMFVIHVLSYVPVFCANVVVFCSGLHGVHTAHI